ncbi:MAG: response regulator transcription factor [Clostridia bacterium]|nr:response regulator transcription factor [Clostridia bacterium]
MLLLLAEDDSKIAELLIQLLKKDGYQVDYAPDGEEALLYCSLNNYDVVILDWMMPEVSGIEVCQNLREKGYPGGILMLTAKDTIEDKIIGLEAGADDYIVKPFEYRELHARIKALKRRSERTLQTNVLQAGPFSLERESNSVYKEGVPLNLSKREYQLFSLLLENSGKTVPREIIIDRVWGLDSEASQNNLDAFIRLLRKKIEKKGEKKVIISVRGIGYKVEV